MVPSVATKEVRDPSKGRVVVLVFESGALLREEVLLVDKRGSISSAKKRFLQSAAGCAAASAALPLRGRRRLDGRGHVGSSPRHEIQVTSPQVSEGCSGHSEV